MCWPDAYRFIGIILISLLVILPSGCGVNIPEPDYRTEIPPKLLSFNTLEEFEVWLQDNYCWVSDKNTTGFFAQYYFTPAEMVMAEIPDVNHPGNIIEKQPFHGDCDDFAIFTAYLLDYLGYESYYVAISNGLVGHAIAYAEKDDDVAIFDLWHYKEGYISLEDYIARKYPNHTIRRKIPINDFLEQLFAEGHIKYDNNFLEEEEG